VRFGGTGFDQGFDLAVDPSGNSYITGNFKGNMTVGTTTLTGVGFSDIFMIKLDALGSPVWAKSFGSTLGDYGYGIGVDTNALVLGVF
jgi:hypothetical protein